MPWNFSPLPGEFLAKPGDLVFLFDVAEVDSLRARELRHVGPDFLVLDDVNAAGAGVGQHTTDVPSDAPPVGHAHDQNRFAGELEEVHEEKGLGIRD